MLIFQRHLTLAANSWEEGIVKLDFKEMRRDGGDSFRVVWRNCTIFLSLLKFNDGGAQIM